MVQDSLPMQWDRMWQSQNLALPDGGEYELRTWDGRVLPCKDLLDSHTPTITCNHLRTKLNDLLPYATVVDIVA